MSYFDFPRLYAPHMCIVLLYGYNIASIGIPFSFITFSFHRLCSLTCYTKPFFKTKRYIAICIISQWIIECIVSLPYIFRKESYCTNEIWMRIFTFMMAVVVPSLINIVLNILIFTHIRASRGRIQPQTVDINAQQRKISRRDISLLKQMIFMFSMFIGGWSPTYLTVILSQFMYTDLLVLPLTALFGELCLLSIMIHLFIYNVKLRQYLLHKIRTVIERFLQGRST